MNSEQTILQALAQAKDEEATRIFHDCLRDLVRVGLLKTMAAEVEMLCGPKYHPEQESEFRRAGSEGGTRLRQRRQGEHPAAPGAQCRWR